MTSLSDGWAAMMWRGCRRDDDQFAGLGDAGGDEDAQSGKEVELPEEAAWPVVGDELLVVARAGDDVDRTGDDDEEVVSGVAFAVEVLAFGDSAAGAERVERGDLGGVEGRERCRVFSHLEGTPGDWRGGSPFSLSVPSQNSCGALDVLPAGFEGVVRTLSCCQLLPRGTRAPGGGRSFQLTRW